MCMRLDRVFCLAFFALSYGITTLQAQSELVLETIDGKSETYSLKEIRKITFGDNLLNIMPKNSVKSDSYLFEHIMKMYFRKEGSSLTYIGQESPLRLVQCGNSLSVEGFNGVADLYIYDINGRAFCKTMQWKGGSIDISDFPNGIYILLVGNQPFKFIK